LFSSTNLFLGGRRAYQTLVEVLVPTISRAVDFTVLIEAVSCDFGVAVVAALFEVNERGDCLTKVKVAV